ncbi:Uncharacterised protein g4820 [Pycnogonum litorale]
MPPFLSVMKPYHQTVTEEVAVFETDLDKMTPAIPYMDSNISCQSYDAANTPQQTVSAYDNDWNVNLIPSSSTYEFQEPGYGENVIDDPDYVPDLIVVLPQETSQGDNSAVDRYRWFVKPCVFETFSTLRSGCCKFVVRLLHCCCTVVQLYCCRYRADE